MSQARLSGWELGKAHLPKPFESQIRDLISRIDALVEEGRIPRRKRYRSTPGDGPRGTPAPITAARAKEWARIAGEMEYPADSYSDALSRMPPFRRGGPTGVSLFSGCGGMSLGFRWAGVDVLGFVEKDPAARASYRLNLPETRELAVDVCELTPDLLSDAGLPPPGGVDFLFGGPPCQGFSLTGKRDRQDPRNVLFRVFVDAAAWLRPRVVVIENVRLLTSMRNADGRLVAQDISRALGSAGYRTRMVTVNARDFGVPQARERVIFLGFRDDLRESKWGILAERVGRTGDGPPLTFEEATANLTTLESGEHDPLDPYHWAVRHPDHVLQWLRGVPEGASAHENFDPALRPPSGYNTTYKRLRSDEPGATIATTFGMISASRTVHPRSTRSLTPREAMRIQSMPDTFTPIGSWGEIRRVIGNAVPPLLAYGVVSRLMPAVD